MRWYLVSLALLVVSMAALYAPVASADNKSAQWRARISPGAGWVNGFWIELRRVPLIYVYANLSYSGPLSFTSNNITCRLVSFYPPRALIFDFGYQGIDFADIFQLNTTWYNASVSLPIPARVITTLIPTIVQLPRYNVTNSSIALDAVIPLPLAIPVIQGLAYYDFTAGKIVAITPNIVINNVLQDVTNPYTIDIILVYGALLDCNTTDPAKIYLSDLNSFFYQITRGLTIEILEKAVDFHDNIVYTRTLVTYGSGVGIAESFDRVSYNTSGNHSQVLFLLYAGASDYSKRLLDTNPLPPLVESYTRVFYEYKPTLTISLPSPNVTVTITAPGNYTPAVPVFKRYRPSLTSPMGVLALSLFVAVFVSLSPMVGVMNAFWLTMASILVYGLVTGNQYLVLVGFLGVVGAPMLRIIRSGY